jgi:hypothetical protein
MPFVSRYNILISLLTLNAEVKECVELYLHSPDRPSWHGAQLKHRVNFIYFLHSIVFVSHITSLNSRVLSIKVPQLNRSHEGCIYTLYSRVLLLLMRLRLDSGIA